MDITEAVRLRSQGEPWRRIYLTLGKHSRDEQHAQREAVLTNYRLGHKTKTANRTVLSDPPLLRTRNNRLNHDTE
jgi:hypothetical protein